MQTVYLIAAGCEIDLHLWQFLHHQSYVEKISLVLQEVEWLRSQVNCFDLLSWEKMGLEDCFCSRDVYRWNFLKTLFQRCSV